MQGDVEVTFNPKAENQPEAAMLTAQGKFLPENATNEDRVEEDANKKTMEAAVENAASDVGLDYSVCEKDVDSDEDNDDETKENYEGFNGTGRTVTLPMLMSANVLQPGKSVMTIEYLGQKFVGDLLPDGKIKSQETETIFLTPSAWAMYCKRIINPEKKSGCGWASVKYKGKKLDAYKNSWLRKCALQKDFAVDDTDADKKSESPLPVIKRIVFPHNTINNRSIMHDANMLIEAVPFSTVGKLQPFLLTVNSSALLLADFHCHITMHEVCGYFAGNWDVNTHTLQIKKAYPCRNSRFERQKAADIERDIQKQIKKDQLILVGWYHSHPKFQAEPTLRDCDSQLDYQIRMRGPTELTYTPCVSFIISPYYDENPTLESVVKSIWIMPPNETKQTLEYGRPMLMQYSILPEKQIPDDVRTEIQSCVDYYSQFRNEVIKFRNIYSDDTTYIEKLKNTLYPKFPEKENDKALWNWICNLLGCEQENDFVPPKTIKILDNTDEPIKPEFPPISQQANELKIEESKDGSASLIKEIPTKLTDEQVQTEQQKAHELKVLSLQEQLCLPSGLNMNPVRMLSPLATPNPIGVPAVTPIISPAVSISAPTSATSLLPPLPPIISQANSIPIGHMPFTTAISTPTTMPVSQSIPIPPTPTTSAPVIATPAAAVTLPGISPRDSPITIPSNSVSPAKFEMPVRASPSPAKSDASSHTSRTRNSPAPSPGKFSISDIARNSPSITPNKYDPPSASSLVPPSASATCIPTANDLMAASLAQLAGQLPPNFLQTDLAALFQQQPQPQTQQQQLQRKDYGNSSLNQLAAAAAKVGSTTGQKQPQAPSTAAHNVVSGSVDLTDPTVAAAVAAYSNSFHTLTQPPVSQLSSSKSKSERSSKSSSSSSSSSCSSSNSYKTKLMKELDDLKNDPLKMTELMRSPEYAALLLQQAEALGATTLGTLGFGADFSYLTGAGLGLPGSNNNSSNTNAVSSSSNNNKSKSAAIAAAQSAAALTADYNNLIQASKLLGYDAYIQQAKSSDFNSFLQQQMGAAAAAVAASLPPSTTSSSSKKQQQSQHQQQTAPSAHPDYTTLLQTYSKLFDPSNQFGSSLNPVKGSSSSAHHELSALLAAGVGGIGGSGNVLSNLGTSNVNSKQKQKELQAQQQHQQHQQADMLNQLLASEKQQSELNALLYHHHQSKAAADLNALFTAPLSAPTSSTPTSSKSGGGGGGSTSNSTGAPSPLTDPAAYYNALALHGKYGIIPDPLSKTTLAANNMFMSPSALLKIQQESLSAMMMKPPKSTSSAASINAGGLGRTRESSVSPALERLTPTKLNTSSSVGAGKYNFSAVDLAISSVSSNTPSPAPSDGSNSSSHRRPSNTPPVDLSRLYGDLAPPHLIGVVGATKKRMEFSSIADLAAPPPAKMPKPNEDVLNLSHD